MTEAQEATIGLIASMARPGDLAGAIIAHHAVIDELAQAPTGREKGGA